LGLLLVLSFNILFWVEKAPVPRQLCHDSIGACLRTHPRFPAARTISSLDSNNLLRWSAPRHHCNWPH